MTGDDQAFCPGRELSVSVLEDPTTVTQALAQLKLLAKNANFDYEAKYDAAETDEIASN